MTPDDMDIRDAANQQCVKDVMDYVTRKCYDLPHNERIATVHVAFAVCNLSAIMDAVGRTNEMFTDQEIHELGILFLKNNVAEFDKYCDLIARKKVQ